MLEKGGYGGLMFTLLCSGHTHTLILGRWATLFISHAYGSLIDSSLLLGATPLDWLFNGFIWLLIICCVLWPFLLIPLLDWLDFRRQRTVETVLFELVPYHVTQIPAATMEELFKIIHAQCAPHTYIDHLFRRKRRIVLEVSASREGMHYFAQVSALQADSFQQVLAAFQREIECKRVYENSLSVEPGRAVVETFRQLRSFMFPLHTHGSLDIHDPITYLTGALVNPKSGDALVLQFVLAPYTRPWHVVRLRSRVGRRKVPLPIRDRAADKLKEPLFYVDVRACVLAATHPERDMRLTNIASALSTFDEPGFQMLVPGSSLLRYPVLRAACNIVVPGLARQAVQDMGLKKFVQRLPSVLTAHSNVLAASEIAGLYHFPYKQAGTTEGLSRSMSRTLAVPASVSRSADDQLLDLVLGENVHHGNTTAVGLTKEERERHVYIVGGTGNGKTAMLEYGIVQDMRSGKGVAMIDPHGDSARKLLRYVPKERLKDVIYFNPRDYDYPIGLNVLELSEGLVGSALAHEKDLITEAVISLLRKTFDGEDGGAYRIERILRNAIQTALVIKDATLFTVLQLLTDAAYRKRVAHKLNNERLKRFWLEEFGRAGDMQRIKMAMGPITRLERFEASESVRRVLGRSKSTINFDDIISSGKILICNFSKGSLGEDTSSLFGTIVLTELQLAAWRREKIGPNERKPFYVYVDEFQSFATESFISFFSEARKYKLFVIMAQQSVSQLKDQSLLTTILDNAGTVVAFRSKSPATEALLLHQFKPYIQQGDILNLPSYSFYAKVAATVPIEPLSGKTIVLPSDEADESLARRAVAQSRKTYTTPQRKTS